MKYNLSDFRTNLRRAFNEADNGREVLIERYGNVYRLQALVGSPDKNGHYARGGSDEAEDDGQPISVGDKHTVKFTLPKPDIINTPAQAIEKINKINQVSPKLCKHGKAPNQCRTFGCAHYF